MLGDPQLIATKNRGTTTFTDYDYTITAGYTDDLLWYDVRLYYSTENSYSDPSWLAVFGELMPKTTDSTSMIEQPLEFGVSSFPNPFNPTTKIRVSIPNDDNLQVSIFNLLGERVLELKNEAVTKGIYEFTWNGRDSHSNLVNSGVYVVLVKTNSKVTSQKIVLLK